MKRTILILSLIGLVGFTSCESEEVEPDTTTTQTTTPTTGGTVTVLHDINNHIRITMNSVPSDGFVWVESMGGGVRIMPRVENDPGMMCGFADNIFGVIDTWNVSCGTQSIELGVAVDLIIEFKGDFTIELLPNLPNQ